MIKIGKPYLENVQNLYYIKCMIYDNDIPKEVFWGGVEDKYSKYLLIERGDAFLVGLLSYAMRTGQDIECDVPISEELLYNIQQYLIPLVVKYGNNLHMVKITAKTVSEQLENAGMVGASASCGVDSFNTITNQYNSKYKSMNITHLCLNDVGAYDNGNIEKQKFIKKQRYIKGKQFANEIGLPIILTESNFGKIFPQNHFLTNTYSSCFSILCMRKLWKTYYYSSAFHDIGLFSLFNNESKDSSYYDLLTLNCFSTDGLHIYSEGGERTRLDKVFNIANSELAKKYLHVCTKSEYNCGICNKCRRTLICLDITGKLEAFSNVFNIEYYKKNRIEYMDWFYQTYLNSKLQNQDMYNYLCNDPDMLQAQKEFKEIKHLLDKLKIIIYGYSKLGQEIEKKYEKQVKFKIDNFVKGNDIITFDAFRKEFSDFEEDYICIINSLSKFYEIKKDVQKYYPNLKILSGCSVKILENFNLN